MHSAPSHSWERGLEHVIKLSICLSEGKQREEQTLVLRPQEKKKKKTKQQNQPTEKQTENEKYN